MRHITVRMAWHDSGWDGTVCAEPAANSYCVGSHSLLSDRLARNRCLEKEQPGQSLDARMPEYLPPCYWTSAAFSQSPVTIVHRHPFSRYQESKQIHGNLEPNSVFTWPFRLSMTHSAAVRKKHGNYFKDLEPRIARFREQIVPHRSLVFFYLNYDNPISADDYRYALVGCSMITGIADSGHFEFEQNELDRLRSNDGMQNFPTLNWALRVSHAGPTAAVRLPYAEYLRHVQDHPEDEPKLEAMRSLIEEPALVPAFKYVSESMDHDQCLAILYKLRRAFRAVEEHGIVPAGDSLERIDGYIEHVWNARGLYPGLPSVVSLLADLAEGEPNKESRRGHAVIEAVRESLSEGEDLLEVAFQLLARKRKLADATKPVEAVLRDAQAGLSDNKALLPALRRLSLFSLTPRQLARILFPDLEPRHPFGGIAPKLSEIVDNPYVLSESYLPAIDDDKERDEDLDRESLTDRPIDYFTIDMGMFPDTRFVERHAELHDLTVAGPQRLRAFAIEALRGNEDRGHSFASAQYLLERALEHPLIHKDAIALREDHFVSNEAKGHFASRIHIEESDGRSFFYLKETKEAEEIVRSYVVNATSSDGRKVDLSWLDIYLKNEVDKLQGEITGFDSDGFIAERRQLMTGALTRSLYCITGRPGSGKTQALREVLNRLDDAGEKSVVLAPTGKAALRLNDGRTADGWKAETIDHWLFRRGLAAYANADVSLMNMSRSERWEPVVNLIVDEMSMVGLNQLALLFRALEVHQPGLVKRVILVGDESQLAPIGCGRPFADIIEFLTADATRASKTLVRLATNCRQKHDPTVLDAAHLFAGKNRYHTELWERLLKGGNVSDYLQVHYWESPGQLDTLISGCIQDALDRHVGDHTTVSGETAFNKLMGLYDNGFVPNNDASALSLDRAQVLTPYRGGAAGALRLGQFIRSAYRHESWPSKSNRDSAFAHSDKIIRIKNYYGWNSETRTRELRLSNGSIGVLCNNRSGRKGYFAESRWPVDWERMDEEDFELAYAISVHKSQGSEFQDVIVALPERRALLTRELVYTALTRSKSRLTLLVQKSPRANPLLVARDRSDLATRNSSVFSRPAERQRMFEPEAGVKVKSKVEYVIYKALQAARDRGELVFDYERERELTIDGRRIKVHPDFTIAVGGATYYWEHLGMLDRRDYAADWRSRLAAYKSEGLLNVLVTTDDLAGLQDERLNAVVKDIVSGSLTGGPGGKEFSDHHYCL